MPTATLRTVGGSIVIAIPKRLLEMVQLQAGSKVDINVEQGHLVVIPQKKRRYMLSDLLAQFSGVNFTIFPSFRRYRALKRSG